MLAWRQATQSALITVCIGNGELRAARRVYEETLRLGIAPHLHAYNCLINAYAAHFRLGDVVRICSWQRLRSKCDFNGIGHDLRAIWHLAGAHSNFA